MRRLKRVTLKFPVDLPVSDLPNMDPLKAQVSTALMGRVAAVHHFPVRAVLFQVNKGL